MTELDRRSRRHTIAILVDNESGVLARVIGLFSGRGYNIESLTVAETDNKKSLSRVTIVTSGTPMVIEQIKAQLSFNYIVTPKWEGKAHESFGTATVRSAHEDIRGDLAIPSR